MKINPVRFEYYKISNTYTTIDAQNLNFLSKAQPEVEKALLRPKEVPAKKIYPLEVFSGGGGTIPTFFYLGGGARAPPAPPPLATGLH